MNDHDIPGVLKAAAEAGAKFAGYEMLRLPHGLAKLFEDWLTRHYPDRKDKVLAHIRAVRGGKLNDSRFGTRMRGEGIIAEQALQMFRVARRKTGISDSWPELATTAFCRPESGAQLGLGL